MAVVIFILSLLAITNADNTWSYYNPQRQSSGYGGYAATTQVPRNAVYVDLPSPNSNGYGINIGNGRHRQNNVVISQGGSNEPGYIYAETSNNNHPYQTRSKTTNGGDLNNNNNRCLTRNGQIVRYGNQPCKELNQNNPNQYGNSRPSQRHYNSNEEEGIFIDRRPDGSRVINIGNGLSNRNSVVIGDEEFSNYGPRTRSGVSYNLRSTNYPGQATPSSSPRTRPTYFGNPTPHYRTRNDDATSNILIGRGKNNRNFVITDS